MKVFEKEITTLQQNGYGVYSASTLAVLMVTCFMAGAGITIAVLISIFWGNVG